MSIFIIHKALNLMNGLKYNIMFVINKIGLTEVSLILCLIF